MNAHIAKPIDVEELISVLMTWLPQRLKVAESSLTVSDTPLSFNDTQLKSSADFDLDVTLSWLGGDPVLLKKILASFQLDLEKTGDKLHDAIHEKNWVAVKSIAHKLNGTGGNMGAVTLQRHAAALEAELMEKPVADASALQESIDQTLKLCKGFLQEMANTGATEHLPGRAEINKAFDELAALLTNNRLVPMNLLDKVQPARAFGVNEALLEKLGQQTTMFQYKDALLTLELIKSELELKS
jgi:HPt (histidine-containing phosphotransfer) domain-containing protein